MVKKDNKFLGSVRAGAVNANVIQTKYGYTFAISKSYKDKKTDEWKDTPFFNPSDIFKLQNVLEKIITRFNLEEKTDDAVFKEYDPDDSDKIDNAIGD